MYYAGKFKDLIETIKLLEEYHKLSYEAQRFAFLSELLLLCHSQQQSDKYCADSGNNYQEWEKNIKIIADWKFEEKKGKILDIRS